MKEILDDKKKGEISTGPTGPPTRQRHLATPDPAKLNTLSRPAAPIFDNPNSILTRSISEAALKLRAYHTHERLPSSAFQSRHPARAHHNLRGARPNEGCDKQPPRPLCPSASSAVNCRSAWCDHPGRDFPSADRRNGHSDRRASADSQLL